MKINKEKEASLTQERLKEMLEYNSTTGEFVWIERKQGRKFGQSAGCVKNSDGYIEIGIDGCEYKAHRLVWLYVYGKFPTGDKPFIDHIDGNPSNNRIENLRESSNAENSKNKRMMTNNVSGITGIRYRDTPHRSGKLYHHWIASWYDRNGKQRQKSFNVEKLGEYHAKQMAINYRTERLRLLEVEYDIIYSERHGK